uniref:Schwann cell-specific EGF-like repeat autocrine factor n=1 Tax=Lates calcarifer TaxID=8187 RepID=A0A4W6CPU1_LATCA
LSQPPHQDSSAHPAPPRLASPAPPLPLRHLGRAAGASRGEVSGTFKGTFSSISVHRTDCLSLPPLHSQPWDLWVSARRFCFSPPWSLSSAFVPRDPTRPEESRSGSFSTPKRSAIRRANTQESASATTHASAPGAIEGETCQYANCYPKCKNGGECLRPGKCRCPPGYGGRYCHKVTCDGGCWNGGECTAVNGVAKCICPSSWTGSKCQEAICPQGCRNGGICVAPGICSCPEGWLGGACHTAVCTLPCLNGGKCISPDKCRCRPPYSGPRCEERKKSH